MFNNFHKTIVSLLLAAAVLAPHAAVAQQPESRTGFPESASTGTAADALPDPSVGHGDIMLLLDNSGSMRANDPDLLMAKAVRDFIGKLEFNTRLGIVIFDQTVRLSFPLTELSDASRAAMLASLEQIDYRGLHTNSPDGLERAIYELKLYSRKDAERFIVFLTDGIVDTGDKQKDASKLDWMRKELAADARNNDIKIFGIAFTDGADFQLIQSLAQQTGAGYYRAFTAEQISPVFARIQDAIAAARLAAAEAAAEAAKPVPPPAPVEPSPPPKPIIVKIPEQTAGTDTETRYLLYGIAGLLIVVLLALLVRGRSGAGPASVAAGGAGIPCVKLVDISGISGAKEHFITTPITQIGRIAGKQTLGVTHIVIPEKSVSRHHAVIEYRSHGFWVMDQGSGNGTRLNDARLEEEKQLRHGDMLAFGDFVFEFTEPDMEHSDATVVQAAGTGTASDMESTMLMSSAEPAGAGSADDVEAVDVVDVDNWLDDIEADPALSDPPAEEQGDGLPADPDNDMTLAEFDRLFDEIDADNKKK